MIGLKRKTLIVLTTVSISELKANLSRFVREVQTLDRGTPVARLVPVVAGDHLGVRERIVQRHN